MPEGKRLDMVYLLISALRDGVGVLQPLSGGGRSPLHMGDRIAPAARQDLYGSSRLAVVMRRACHGRAARLVQYWRHGHLLLGPRHAVENKGTGRLELGTS
jgi:hypothetical protein